MFKYAGQIILEVFLLAALIWVLMGEGSCGKVYRAGDVVYAPFYFAAWLMDKSNTDASSALNFAMTARYETARAAAKISGNKQCFPDMLKEESQKKEDAKEKKNGLVDGFLPLPTPINPDGADNASKDESKKN